MIPDFSESRVRPTEVTTAKELYDLLDENNPLWRHGDWVFRGQPDASKALLPTALRPEFMKKYVVPVAEPCLHEFMERQRDKPSNFNDFRYRRNRFPGDLHFDSEEYLERYFRLATHTAVEKCIVWAFERLADRAALDVPHERGSTWGGSGRRSLDDELEKIIEEKPRRQQFLPNHNVFALARHHALPVRMLDWTVRPHKAAFFAADQSTSCNQSSDDLVVWAVDRETLESSGSLRLFEPLRTPIGFLRSQEGLFMYDLDADETFMMNGNWQPFDDRLFQFPNHNQAYKFVLPRMEADELLFLLRSKGITKSNLMPSYDNVAWEITSGRIDWKRIHMDSK
ncbi:MAG: FRG domain-containing protein [Chloroflexi bacterium]|nr:FRG domain-containing protein [Chloroflexota bacterium]